MSSTNSDSERQRLYRDYGILRNNLSSFPGYQRFEELSEQVYDTFRERPLRRDQTEAEMRILAGKCLQAAVLFLS